MQAIVYHDNKDIRLEEVPEPVPGPGEVKLRITGTSICATDIEEWQFGPLWVQHGSPNALTGKQTPLVIGHEMAGRVAELGEGVENMSVGDRVAINTILTCGTCFWCMRGQQAVCPNMAVAGFMADGGLAEFMVWPADHLVPMPDSISDVEAPLLEPATVAVHGVRRSGVKPGDTVAVIGCGTVGLLTLQAFKAAGVRVIAIDVRELSLELATQLGADEVVNSRDEQAAASRILELTNGIGPDIVIETAGAKETPRMAIEWTRRGGTVLLIGIYSTKPEIDFNSIVGTEKTVIGSVATSPGDLEAAVELVAGGKINVKPLISEVVPLSRAIEDGFNRMLDPNKKVFRIVIQPGL
ncbi:MAG TPA: butanediol dehydrogenase [Dehalococcoidia bacterium]|jgi:(R,R)-butanediol dehydrogenase/meso-butanediol dehydrogenase/diacetyl reductase|nr:zinc-binding dehydrogenase [Chloroflexota bacterium]HIM60900.1 butanediol dehydrogenase [Dehalococcoidia bacterium]